MKFRFVLFSVLDRNKPETFSCSCIFCAKWLRPLVVPGTGWEMTDQQSADTCRIETPKERVDCGLQKRQELPRDES